MFLIVEYGMVKTVPCMSTVAHSLSDSEMAGLLSIYRKHNGGIVSILC